MNHLPADSPYRTDIQVRFGDTDAFGHLNNVSYAQYVELARVELFRDLGVPTRSLILARLALDFRRQVRYGDRVFVLTTVTRVGNSSVTLQQDVYADDTLAAEVGSVVVLFDYAADRPKTIPDDLRAKLEAMGPVAG